MENAPETTPENSSEAAADAGPNASTAETAHLDALRQRLLEAAVERAPFEGWTPTMLARAEVDAGLPVGTLELICPDGAVDLIDYWGMQNDRETDAAVSAMNLGEMRIRDRVRLGVKVRLAAIGREHKEAARRAALRLALPDSARRGTHMLWRTVDTIWRAIGDESTDANFYSKRLVLSSVFASAFAAWLSADGEEEVQEAKLDAHLDDAIEGVMQFEKTKAKVRDAAKKLPDPITMLAKIRFGK